MSDDAKTHRYRSYTITQRYADTTTPRWDQWEFVSDSYDGPGDPRFSYERTFADCIERIDEIEEDYSDDDSE